MKKVILIALVLALAIPFTNASAGYSDADAWNVAKQVVTSYIEDNGGTSLRFAIIDYNVNQNNNRYAVYSDVKYVDNALRNQRDYFVVMFDETGDGYEFYMMTIGAKIISPSTITVDATWP